MINRVTFLLAVLLAVLPVEAVGTARETLRASPSEFVRTHADHAVDWMTWGDGAFERASREARPLFVAIGSASSPLSRAMAAQTFSDPAVASLLNDHFVCVLVDREEHPAVAAQGQAYVRAVQQRSGWPLNLWLTPDLQPFEGAAYLPPTNEWGIEDFSTLARRAADQWRRDPEAARQEAAAAVAALARMTAPARPQRFHVPTVRTALQGSAAAWREQSDPVRGGFGEIPRHAEPELLRFLLVSDAASRDAAAANLRAVLASALRDPLDGGFFHHTTDPLARVPSLQKFLVDQARMALALLDAARFAGDAQFAGAARDALDYVLARLALPSGGFAAGEEATSAHEVGYYLWTFAELEAELGARAADTFASAHGARAEGNIAPGAAPSTAFLGSNVLAGAPDPAFAGMLSKLRAARDRRPPPARHEMGLARDHGLLLAALARAGAELDEPRFTEAAKETAAYIERAFVRSPAGDLGRIDGSATPAGPDDYSSIVLGLRAFGTPHAHALAARLAERVDALFLDARTGTIFTTTAELPAGIWVRLPAPASAPGAPPSPEPLRLLAGEPLPEPLAASLANQHRDASRAASGDILLALRKYLDLMP